MPYNKSIEYEALIILTPKPAQKTVKYLDHGRWPARGLWIGDPAGPMKQTNPRNYNAISELQSLYDRCRDARLGLHLFPARLLRLPVSVLKGGASFGRLVIHFPSKSRTYSNSFFFVPVFAISSSDSDIMEFKASILCANFMDSLSLR